MKIEYLNVFIKYIEYGNDLVYFDEIVIMMLKHELCFNNLARGQRQAVLFIAAWDICSLNNDLLCIHLAKTVSLQLFFNVYNGIVEAYMQFI